VSDGAARKLLGSLSLFRELQDETLDRIARRLTRRSFPRNRLLFRAGDPSEGLWIVERGRVRLYRANRDGKEQVLHEQGPGQSLAEVPLFDGGPYPANARAEEDSVLLFLGRDDFREIYRSEPEVADAVIRELGGRLRRAVSLIEKISLRDVPSRVGLTLLEMARAGDRRGDQAFALPMSQARLAERLATTRESVARALRTLQDEGLIEREGSRIRIPDPEALEDRCYQG
jgi:CRP-like cAMP-binding protein